MEEEELHEIGSLKIKIVTGILRTRTEDAFVLPMHLDGCPEIFVFEQTPFIERIPRDPVQHWKPKEIVEELCRLRKKDFPVSYAFVGQKPADDAPFPVYSACVIKYIGANVIRDAVFNVLSAVKDTGLNSVAFPVLGIHHLSNLSIRQAIGAMRNGLILFAEKNTKSPTPTISIVADKTFLPHYDAVLRVLKEVFKFDHRAGRHVYADSRRTSSVPRGKTFVFKDRPEYIHVGPAKRRRHHRPFSAPQF